MGTTKRLFAGIVLIIGGLLIASCVSPQYTAYSFQDFSFSGFGPQNPQFLLYLDREKDPIFADQTLEAFLSQSSSLASFSGLLGQEDLKKRLKKMLVFQGPQDVQSYTLGLINLDAPGFVLETALKSSGMKAVKKTFVFPQAGTPDAESLESLELKYFWSPGLLLGIAQEGLVLFLVNPEGAGNTGAAQSEEEALFAYWYQQAKKLSPKALKTEPRDQSWYRTSPQGTDDAFDNLLLRAFIDFSLKAESNTSKLDSGVLRSFDLSSQLKRLSIWCEPADPQASDYKLILQFEPSDANTQLLARRLRLAFFGLANVLGLPADFLPQLEFNSQGEVLNLENMTFSLKEAQDLIQLFMKMS